eukprot:scaffold3.g6343.t1
MDVAEASNAALQDVLNKLTLDHRAAGLPGARADCGARPAHGKPPCWRALAATPTAAEDFVRLAPGYRLQAELDRRRRLVRFLSLALPKTTPGAGASPATPRTPSSPLLSLASPEVSLLQGSLGKLCGVGGAESKLDVASPGPGGRGQQQWALPAAAGMREAARQQRQRQVAFICGGRRAVNIEVLIRRVGRPADVAASILTLDCERIQPGFAAELLANLPDERETAALHAFLDTGGEPCLLAPADRLFAALRPAGGRLPALLRLLELGGMLNEAEADLVAAASGAAAVLWAVCASPGLRMLLHAALAAANALNAGRRLPAAGIKMDSLRRVLDTRAWAGSCTMVHYLAALASQSAPGALALLEPGGELSGLAGKWTRQWTLSELRSRLAALEEGAALVAREKALVAVAEEGEGAAHGAEPGARPSLWLRLHGLQWRADAACAAARAAVEEARQATATTMQYLEEVNPDAWEAVQPRQLLSLVHDFAAAVAAAAKDAQQLEVCRVGRQHTHVVAAHC